MSKGTDPFILRNALDAVTEQRDTALATNEALARDAELQRRQLVAEQDRFVSHLIETHERDMERLKGELRTANETITRLNADVVLARAMLDDAMNEEVTPRPFQSMQPVSGPHPKPRAQRESGIVGRMVSDKPGARAARPRRP